MNRLASCLLMIAVVSGCSGARDLSPLEVSQRFWAAMEQDNLSRVKRFVTPADATALAELDDVVDIRGAEFGRIVIDGQEATIDTEVTTGVGDDETRLPLKTYLTENQGRWRVDYEQTIAALQVGSKIERVLSQVREYGSRLSDGLDRSFQEFENALPRIEQEVERIEQELRAQMPELRARIESFARQVEEVMKRATEGTDSDTPEQDSVPPPAAEPEVEPAAPGEPIRI